MQKYIEILQNKTTEELISLYHQGYIIQPDIKTLVECPAGCYSTTNYILAFGVGILTGYLLNKGFEKIKK